jgi:uncharacterized coiled-coil protein SlyX
MKRLILTGGIALALAGCQTHLEVRQDGAGPYVERDGGLRAGVDYGLPMLQFKLAVRRTLASCVNKDKAIEIRFLTKVTAEPHYVVGERYIVNYPALSGWSKTSKFELQTYDNGAIKSVNAEAEDHTAAIIGDVVKTGIGLLSLSSGVPLALQEAQQPPGTKFYRCSASTILLLKDIEAATADLKVKTKRLVEANDQVARMERLASQNALTDSTKKLLEAANNAVREQSKAVTAAQESLDGLIDRASASEQQTWPRKVDDTILDAAPNRVSREKLLGLFTLSADSPQGYTEARLAQAMALRALLTPTVPLPAQAKCRSDQGATCEPKELKHREAEGLIYRSPVQAHLLVCQVGDPQACTVEGATAVVVSTDVLAPQLGPLRLLPMKNGIFQNSMLKATFRENGGVATFNYDEKAARGKALSSASSAAVTELLAYRDARQAFKDKKVEEAKAEEAAKKKAVLDELDAEIARLEKTKKISELNMQSVRTVDSADVEAETAKLNAQIALLEARRKLAEAEAALAKPVGP